MKKLIQITIVILFTQGVVKAQNFSATPYMEHTPFNVMLGTSLGYTFSCSREVGVFYQSHYENINVVEKHTEVFEKEFVGVFFSAPIKCWDKAALSAKVRAGMANGDINGNMFVISPSFHATYTPSKRVHIGAGVALRSIIPSFITSIKIDLGKLN